MSDSLCKGSNCGKSSVLRYDLVFIYGMVITRNILLARITLFDQVRTVNFDKSLLNSIDLVPSN